MSLTLRLDKDFPLDEWIALYRLSDYNLGWGQRMRALRWLTRTSSQRGGWMGARSAH